MAWPSACCPERESMPELPEVEVICRGIRPHLVGRKILAVETSGKRLRTTVPLASMQELLLNEEIIQIERRAKYLQCFLHSGAMLIIHLGMTGNLGIYTPATPPGKHVHVRWSLDNDAELRYRDSRRFGSIIMLSAKEAADRENTVFHTTGPEPFSDAFNAEQLLTLAKGRSLPIKSFIMNNQVVAGVGNIYANESLFRAGIRPDKPIAAVSRKKWADLVDTIREVLSEAITCGGSTISDFVNANQENGYFQINFRVYGRVGQPCMRCGSTLQKAVIGGRASFFCGGCQK